MRNAYGTQLEFIGTHGCFTDLRKGCTERIGTHTGTMIVCSFCGGVSWNAYGTHTLQESASHFTEGLHRTHVERIARVWLKHCCVSIMVWSRVSGHQPLISEKASLCRTWSRTHPERMPPAGNPPLEDQWPKEG